MVISALAKCPVKCRAFGSIRGFVTWAALLAVLGKVAPSFAMAKRAMPQPIVFVTGNAKKLEEADVIKRSGFNERHRIQYAKTHFFKVSM